MLSPGVLNIFSHGIPEGNILFVNDLFHGLAPQILALFIDFAPHRGI
jgi:hypothetical protein